MSPTLRELLAERTATAAPELTVQEADGAVRCLACSHRCFMYPGLAGVCQVRFNHGGELRVPMGYVASMQVDPIEKKPFFHAFPGPWPCRSACWDAICTAATARTGSARRP